MSGVSRGVVVALALVAAFAVVAGAAGVVAADDHDGTNSTVEAEHEGPYGLDELRDGGRLASSDAPASTRRYGDGQLWVRYAPATLGASTDNPQTWQYLESGSTVERSEVYLGGFTGWGGDATELVVTLVYWDEGTVASTDEDGMTVREPAAVDQVVDETTVELGSGYAEETIDLRSAFEDPRRVTMFVEGSEGSAQWNYQVHTTRTAEPVSVDTRGDLALYVLGFLLLTLGATLALMWVARQAHEKAGAGPQYPVTLYLVVIGPALFMAVLFGYRRVLNLVSEAPWVLVPPVALFVTLAVVSWWGDETRTVKLIDMDLTDPDVREDGSGGFPVEIRTYKLAEVGGKEGVVLPGISAYLARTRGAIPEINVRDDTTVTFPGGATHDETYFTNPFKSETIEYERESWSLSHLWNPPEDGIKPHPDAGWGDQVSRLIGSVAWMEVATFAVIVCAGYVVGAVAFASGWLGMAVAALPALLYTARPVKGRVNWDLAPVQFGSVVVAIMQAGEEFDNLADREWFKEQFYSEKGKNTAERKLALEESELSRFGEMIDHMDVEVPDDVEDLEEVDVSGGAPNQGVADDD